MPSSLNTDTLGHTAPEIPDYDFPGDALIGEGAYGQVWYGLYKKDQPRAVKVFKEGMIRGELWKSEYEKLKALDEPPGIVTLYDRGETAEGLPFVAMRLMADKTTAGTWQGRTLKMRISSGDLNLETRWRLVLEMAGILAYMDRQGVYHCDVKPGNVLLSSGNEPRPVLCDFGQSIAEGVSPENVTGTLLYASPEQLKRQDESIRNWDVYSFGVTAWQLLTGRLPRLEGIAEELKIEDAATVLQRTYGSLAGGSTMIGASLDRELIPKIMIEVIELEREIAVPDDFRHSDHRDEMDVIKRCLSLEGDQPGRFQSMTDVVDALRQVVRDRSVAVERRKKIVFATLMVFGMVAAVLAGWQWSLAEKSQNEAEGFAAKATESAVEQKRLAEEASAQRDEANKQRKFAEEQRISADEQRKIADAEKKKALESEEVATLARSTAEGLINSMLYDLKDRLEPLGRADLLDDLSSKSAAYFANLPESQRNEASERERSSMLNNRGEVFLVKGLFEQALTAFDEARIIRAKLLDLSPNDGLRKRDLSITLERIGDTYLVLGGLTEAGKNYRKSLDFRKELKSGKDDPVSSWDVGMALMKLSNVMAQQKDIAGACDLAGQSLILLEPLANSVKKDNSIQRDFATVLMQCGDLYQLGGKGNLADGLYRKSASILAIQFEKSEPDNSAIRRDYSAILYRIAERHIGSGDTDQALKILELALPLARQSASQDRNNREGQRNLALILRQKGEVYLALKDLKKAGFMLGESVSIFDSLLKQARPRLIWLEDAHVAMIAFGDVMAAKKSWREASQQYLKSLSVGRNRIAITGSNDGFLKKHLVVSLYKSGWALRHLNEKSDKADARTHFDEAVKIISESKGDDFKGWLTVLSKEIERLGKE